MHRISSLKTQTLVGRERKSQANRSFKVQALVGSPPPSIRYIVRRSRAGQDDWEILDDSLSQMFFSVEGLASDAEYDFQVRSYNPETGVYSPWSNVFRISTLGGNDREILFPKPTEIVVNGESIGVQKRVEFFAGSKVAISGVEIPESEIVRITIAATGGDSGGNGGGGLSVYSPADVPPDLPNPYDDEFSSETLDSSWQLVNQSAGSSFTPTLNGLVCELGTDSTQMRPLVKEVPSGDFHFTVALYDLFHGFNTFSGFSLLVLNATQDQAQTITIWNNDSDEHYRWYLNQQEYSPLDNRAVHNSLVPPIIPSTPLYLQYVAFNDAGVWRRTFRYSTTGLLWSFDVDAGRAIGFEPAYMGFSLYDRNGSGARALVRWFRVEE